jgi:hypothetical protein
MNDKQIEQLLKIDPDKVQNDTMKAAIQEAKRLRKKQQEEKVVALLQRGQTQIDSLVANLRAIRQQEAEIKKKLMKFSEIFEDFIKNGDAANFEQKWTDFN